MNPRQLSAGRTVYSQGSFAPTKGRVSANGMQGYVQRQIRQQGGVRRMGGDGMSDTRSGLAATAGNRRKMFQQGGGFQNEGRRPASGGGKQWGQGGFQNDGKPVVTGGTVNPVASGGTPGTPSPTPSVVVNANGQLELPYSPAWSEALLAQMGEYNSQLLALQQEQQAAGLEYTAGVANENSAYIGQKRGTLNNASGSGTVFSTAYGTAAMNDAKNHNNTLNQLLADKTASEQAAEAQRTAIINAFKQQMQQQALAYAEEQAASAGDLGYGTASTPVHHGQNSSAYAGGGKGKGKPHKGRPGSGSSGGRKPAPKGPKKPKDDGKTFKPTLNVVFNNHGPRKQGKGKK